MLGPVVEAQGHSLVLDPVSPLFVLHGQVYFFLSLFSDSLISRASFISLL